MQLAADGRLVLADVVTHLTDLDGIPEGLERLRTGAGGRTVAILDGASAGAGRDHAAGVDAAVPRRAGRRPAAPAPPAAARRAPGRRARAAGRRARGGAPPAPARSSSAESVESGIASSAPISAAVRGRSAATVRRGPRWGGGPVAAPWCVPPVPVWLWWYWCFFCVCVY